MTLFKSLVTILTLCTLVGCVNADRESKSQEQGLSEYSTDGNLIAFNNRALFEVGNIELEDIKFSDQDRGVLRTSNAIQLYFRLCNIRDRASQGTIRNERFHIKSELGDNIIWKRSENSTEISNPITVNSGNCLRWSQSVPEFDFFAPSVNVALHFEIESLSGQLGKIVKRIGFNPWDMHRTQSLSSGFFDLTDYDRSDWQSGTWVIGDQVVDALKGDLFDATAELRFDSIQIEPVERTRANVAEFNRQSRELLDEEENQRRNEIEETLLSDRAGLHINVNMNARPVVWNYDSGGNRDRTELNSGRFKVYMNLIARGAADNNERHLLSSNVTEMVGRSASFIWRMNDDGRLVTSVPLVLRNRTEFGRVELLLKVVPVDRGMRNVKPYTAVLDLGQYDQWVRRQTATFSFDENFNPLDEVRYDEYVNSVDGIIDDLQTVREIDRFYFGPLTMRFIRIMPGETATDRTLQYSVETCVEHGLYGSRVGPGLQFDIETEDKGRVHKMRRQTNEDGCLTWFGFLSHKYYRKEVLQEKTANIRFVGTKNNAASNPANNISQWDETINQYEQEFTYYLNPWDEKFTFGWDENEMPDGYAREIEEQRETAPVSKLFIADFKYETMGFRYAIDKYLNLKVKKAVLLKAYPYVLKYNSIVFGRLGTYKLRDGVYLMKVALQKDYLDPAAKGVRIYDEDLEIPYQLAEGEGDEETLAAELNPEADRAYDLYDRQYGPLEPGQSANPRMAYAPNGGSSEQDVDHRLLNEEDLKESRKEYISVQTKLVRVLGGMIITPIEFEVDDLRLMRIRNQFFIQLQTVDEHKLRLATLVDQTLNELFEGQDIDARYEELFTMQEELETLEARHQRVSELMDQYNNERERREARAELAELAGSIESAQNEIYSALGLDQFERGSSEWEERRQAIEERLARLDQYRALVNDPSSGLSNMTRFRNDKRSLINRILLNLNQANVDALESASDQLDPEYLDSFDDDPLQQLFFTDTSDGVNAAQSIIEHRVRQARDAGNDSFARDLDELKFSDFTESPLTPSFDFDLITNDGEHNPSINPDDGKSGLPARTFVGPLTFVYNTNGSSLRPTDILNEQYCRTAFCEAPRMIEQGVPPEDVDSTLNLSEDGDLNLLQDGIYDSGESVNANYENNKYYGYLRAYHDLTVDQLIEDKETIDEKKTRKMELGSQVVNFVRTYGLKYTLLNDNPASRLKAINYDNEDDVVNEQDCGQTRPLERLDECLTDITSGPDILQKNTLFSQLNNRTLPPFLPSLDIGEATYQQERFMRELDVYRLMDLPESYNAVSGEVTEEDIVNIARHGWRNAAHVDPEVSRRLMHRMCFALTANMFTEEFLDVPESVLENMNLRNSTIGMSASIPGDFTMAELKKIKYAKAHAIVESKCHEYVANVYGYPRRRFSDSVKRLEPANEDGTPVEFRYSPIVFERKVRAYETTGRYVYRGGKSLNINLSANFNLSSSHGVQVSTSAAFKPSDFANVIVDEVAKIPFVGGLIKTLVGSFSLTRSARRDESAGRTQGTSVSAGTFLVSQQATFDIELGRYERCLVARFHPSFYQDIRNVLAEEIDDLERLHRNESRRDMLADGRGFDDNEDILKTGVMICTGQIEDRCLPVKEKYYYFTQHFTEGDMLDTADLHNHPWLLQLRGFRDFQVFTSMIGARQVGYIDNNDWWQTVGSRVISDAASLDLQGSYEENRVPEFEVINQENGINWPLDELSRTYFEVLPTFPGLYTFADELGQDVREWPYESTNPGRSFNQCEP